MAHGQFPTSNLLDILRSYDARKQIFSLLSAYDLAKLNLVLGHILNEREKLIYLNPVRDIIWDTSEMSILLDKGLKLFICGSDVPLLDLRIRDPQRYLRENGHQRRLRLYLFGYFSLVSGGEQHSWNQMLRFSISRYASPRRIIRDEQELAAIVQASRRRPFEKAFLTSFGSAMPGFQLESAWHDEVDIPDKTIDLKVYTPSYHDRFLEEIVLPSSVLSGLFGFSRRRTCVFQLLTLYTRALTDTFKIPHIRYFTKQGFVEMHETTTGQMLCFRLGPSLYYFVG